MALNTAETGSSNNTRQFIARFFLASLYPDHFLAFLVVVFFLGAAFLAPAFLVTTFFTAFLATVFLTAFLAGAAFLAAATIVSQNS